MRIFLTASADTTLYQRYPINNAGLDEIIEVGKVAKPEDIDISYSSSAARALINFNITNSGSFPATASYYLNLKIANATNLPYTQQLLINKISGSWTEGSGYFAQQSKPAEDGATWNQYTTAVSWSNTGGDFYNTIPSQSLTLNEYPLTDFRIDVSSILQPVVSQSLVWTGLIIKYPSASEADYKNTGNIKLFSKQTHTIHAPTLEVAWDDSTFVTGSSLRAIPNTLDIAVVPKNTRDDYIRGAKEKIRFIVRDKYPQKNFDAALRYKSKYYLPTSSYFSVVDRQADTVIYPNDAFAKLSCDSTGSYFILDTSPLYKNRYYAVNLHITNNADTDTTVIPEIFTFLVK